MRCSTTHQAICQTRLLLDHNDRQSADGAKISDDNRLYNVIRTATICRKRRANGTAMIEHGVGPATTDYGPLGVVKADAEDYNVRTAEYDVSL